MIATTNLAKEYGARVLFADVSLQLNAGVAVRPGGGERLGEDHLPEGPGGRRGGLRRDGHDRQARAGGRAAAGSVPRRRRDHPGPRDARRRRRVERARRAAAPHRDGRRRRRRRRAAGGSRGHRSPRTTATRWRRAPARCWRGWRSRPRLHRSPLSTLSGGFKLRVLLAQVLVGGVDVLLLDEPTNHLDILTIRWLEKFLAGYAGCAVIISHDQRFLDNVTSHTLDVDYRTITLYTGRYSKAMVEKAATRERGGDLRRARRGGDRAQAGLGRALRRQEHQGHAGAEPPQADREDRGRGAGGQLAPHAAVQGRARAAERARGAGARGRHQVVRRKAGAHRRVADSCGGASAWRSSDPTASASRRCCGSSSSGWRPTPGSVKWGHEVRVGYFPQDHREVLDDADATPLGRWRRSVPAESPTFVRGAARARAVLGRRTSDKRVGAAVGRRGGAAHLRAAGGAEAQRAGARRADQPPGPGGDPRAGRGGEGVHRDGGVRVARPLVRERAGDAGRGDHAARARATSRGRTPSTWPSWATITSTATRWRCARGRSAPRRRSTRRRNGAGAATSGESWEEQKKRRNRAAQLPKLRDKVLAEISAAEARKAEIQTRSTPTRASSSAPAATRSTRW